MDTRKFIKNYRLAFGDKSKLPFAFWYSDDPISEPRKINGCMFKFLPELVEGEPITLNADTITCGGGRYYAGFSQMPERVPNFVSLKEKYKQTPEMVIDFLNKKHIPETKKLYLNLIRIDKLENLDSAEGIFFIANPDILSGLISWTYFDNNDDDSVSTIFGSGCATIFTYPVIENRNNGRRTFLGGFDPSVRPFFQPDELSFSIPMSRFKEMYQTLPDSCLFDTPAWKKVEQRIF